VRADADWPPVDAHNHNEKKNGIEESRE